MGNTELRRITCVTSKHTYFACSDGTLYRKLKNKPREWQLQNPNNSFKNINDVWLNPIKGFKCKKGYLRVDIDANTYSIHRLIALTFIPNDDTSKNQINHINGISSDNRVENLEWCTPKENINHAFNTLKRKPSYGKTGKFGERNKEKIARNDLIESDIVNTTLSYSDIASKHKVTLGIVKNVAKIRKVQRLSKS